MYSLVFERGKKCKAVPGKKKGKTGKNERKLLHKEEKVNKNVSKKKRKRKGIEMLPVRGERGSE